MNIKEIAKIANVSMATVSRCINHPEKVSLDTRNKVLELVNGSTYKKNIDIRNRLDKKEIIALILPSTLCYEGVHDGVREICKIKRYGLEFCLTYYDLEDLVRTVKALISENVDGIIMALDTDDMAAYNLVKEANVPIVCLAKPIKKINENICYINYYDSAYNMTKYIAENNHSICLVTSKNESTCKVILKSGFNDCIDALKYNKNNVSIVEIEDVIESGYQYGLEHLIDNNYEMYFFQYDFVAIGFMKAAKELGIEIGIDIKVVGFNGMKISSYISPELTTVEQPTYRLGQVAARRLFDIIEDYQVFDVEPQEICLNGVIKIRKSCGNKKDIYEIYN